MRRLLRLIDEMVAIGHEHARLPSETRHQAYKTALRDCLLQDLRRHGVNEALIQDGTADDWLALDVELNAQGLAIWIDKQAAK